MGEAGTMVGGCTCGLAGQREKSGDVSLAEANSPANISPCSLMTLTSKWLHHRCVWTSLTVLRSVHWCNNFIHSLFPAWGAWWASSLIRRCLCAEIAHWAPSPTNGGQRPCTCVFVCIKFCFLRQHTYIHTTHTCSHTLISGSMPSTHHEQGNEMDTLAEVIEQPPAHTDSYLYLASCPLCGHWFHPWNGILMDFRVFVCVLQQTRM